REGPGANDVRRRLLQRLGNTNSGNGRGSLQSTVLSQWLRLAARQRLDRLRPGALWLQKSCRQDPSGIDGRQQQFGAPPYARTVLRARAAARGRAYALPRCLCPAGMGGGRPVPADPVVLGPECAG